MDELICLSGFGLVIIGVPIAIIILILKILNKNVTKKDKFRPFILLLAGIVLFFVGIAISPDSIVIKEDNESGIEIEYTTEYNVEKDIEQNTETTEDASTGNVDDWENVEEEEDVQIDIFKDKNYIVNNLLIKYNTMAKTPIAQEDIEKIQRVGRPLWRMNITLSTGVFVMITYNDYSETLFIDYQEETKNNNDLYYAVRDFTMAVDDDITEKMVKSMWAEFEDGKYSNYYGEKGVLGGFYFTCQSNVINNGDTRYIIKSEYKIN